MDQRLDEAATRSKVIELLDACNSSRMDMWMFSGITAGVLDADLVERIMNEELWKRTHEVREYWLGPCEHCRKIANARLN